MRSDSRQLCAANCCESVSPWFKATNGLWFQLLIDPRILYHSHVPSFHVISMPTFLPCPPSILSPNLTNFSVEGKLEVTQCGKLRAGNNQHECTPPSNNLSKVILLSIYNITVGGGNQFYYAPDTITLLKKKYKQYENELCLSSIPTDFWVFKVLPS